MLPSASKGSTALPVGSEMGLSSNTCPALFVHPIFYKFRTWFLIIIFDFYKLMYNFYQKLTNNFIFLIIWLNMNANASILTLTAAHIRYLILNDINLSYYKL